MKRIAFAFTLVAATSLAAPLAAQTRNDGPWWDPTGTSTRSGRVDSRDGRVYDSRGTVYDNRRADGQWRRESRDRNGNIIYVRTRYERDGDLVMERARRDSFGRYRIIDRRVIQSARNRNDRIYRDNDRNNDGYEDRAIGRQRNDRWDQNNGHDNGRHNGQYKNKNKNKNKGRR